MLVITSQAKQSFSYKEPPVGASPRKYVTNPKGVVSDGMHYQVHRFVLNSHSPSNMKEEDVSCIVVEDSCFLTSFQ